MNLTRIIQECQPDEIYNLGAMSHVAVSFDTPEYVGNVDGLGTLKNFRSSAYFRFRERKQKFTKPPLLNCMVGCLRIKMKKGFMMKTLLFIPDLPMGLQKFMGFGLQKIIVRPIICLLVMVFYLTTSLQDEEKLL